MANISISQVQADALRQQYELLRHQALNSEASGPEVRGGWGLVILLRQGMGAWIQALADKQTTSWSSLVTAAVTATATASNTVTVTAAERDWVLALTALVLGRAGGRANPCRHANEREVCHD